MDGDSVEEEPSSVARPLTITEIFRNAFPYYLSMGMTYDEFWHGCPSLVRDYRMAYEIQKKNEEWARWREGQYFFTALLCAAPVMRAFQKGKVEPGKYPDEPWPLTQKEADEREEMHRRERMKRFIAQLNKENEDEIKRRKDNEKKEASKDGGD